MNLSSCQQKAEKVFSDFLQNDNLKELVISGSAGTGKSFLTKRLSELAEYHILINKQFFGMSDKNIFYTATTNKAAVVLCNVLGKETSTIHSLLGLRVKNDFKTGKVRLSTEKHTNALTKSIVFIDEASMVNYELLSYIRKYLGEGCKIIFLGDPYQLAPIGEEESPVFNAPKQLAHLTEIQRQVAGSPIIQFSQEFRAILDSGMPKVWPQFTGQSAVIQNLSGDDFKEVINTEFLKPHEHDDLKILAWSNNRVLAYNTYVRSLLNANPNFEVGEFVLTNKPIMHRSSTYVPTDGIVQIKDIRPAKRADFQGYLVEFGMPNMSWFLPEDWRQVNQHLKNLAKDKRWDQYFQIKDNFLDLRGLHSVTCHKAQGSTYKQVFIDLSDIGRNNKWQEVARLVYVAISRASEAVYLYGELPIKNWKK